MWVSEECVLVFPAAPMALEKVCSKSACSKHAPRRSGSARPWQALPGNTDAGAGRTEGQCVLRPGSFRKDCHVIDQSGTGFLYDLTMLICFEDF